MSQWTNALTDERKEEAKALYLKLKAIGWDDLSRRDRIAMQLLGWFCLEEDTPPLTLIDADLVETIKKE